MSVWWIATGELDKGGKKVLGPFPDQGLAFAVRGYLEAVPQVHRFTPLARQQATFWVVEEDAHNDQADVPDQGSRSDSQEAEAEAKAILDRETGGR